MGNNASHVKVVDWGGELPDNAPLWRYMKLSTFLLLLDGKAFFPSVATLQRLDPLEGDLIVEPEWLMRRLQDVSGEKWTELCSWLRKNANGWEKTMLDGPSGLQDQCQHARQQTRAFAEIYTRSIAMRRAVWCWYWAEEESAAMWSLYANAGIAVRTSVADLRMWLTSSTDIFVVSRIKYVKRDAPAAHPAWFNPESPANLELIHRPHLIKGIEYGHEREVRVSAVCYPGEKCLLVHGIEPEKLIKEVVISPSIPHDEAEAIVWLVRDHLARRFESITGNPKGPEVIGGQGEKNSIGFSQLIAGQNEAMGPSMPVVRRSSLLGKIRDDEETDAMLRNYRERENWVRRENLPPPLDAL